jgi:hypothetical protein
MDLPLQKDNNNCKKIIPLSKVTAADSTPTAAGQQDSSAVGLLSLSTRVMHNVMLRLAVKLSVVGSILTTGRIFIEGNLIELVELFKRSNFTKIARGH